MLTNDWIRRNQCIPLVPSKHADVGMRSAASRVGVDTAASAIDRYDNVGLMMGESWHLIGSMPGERRHVNVGNW